MADLSMSQLSYHFHRDEFACKCGCGFNTVDSELITVLETIRAQFKKPVVITSGCRCFKHNTKSGGSDNSQHIYGRAADFKIEGVAPAEVARFVDELWPNQYGLGVYSSWTHIDTRTKGPARWG